MKETAKETMDRVILEVKEAIVINEETIDLFLETVAIRYHE